MSYIENRVASIQLRQPVVRRVSLASSCPVCGCRAAMPCGTVVNRMAVGVVHIELDTVTSLVFQSYLQGVVVRVRHIQPGSQVSEIRIRETKRIDLFGWVNRINCEIGPSAIVPADIVG